MELEFSGQKLVRQRKNPIRRSARATFPAENPAVGIQVLEFDSWIAFLLLHCHHKRGIAFFYCGGNWRNSQVTIVMTNILSGEIDGFERNAIRAVQSTMLNPSSVLLEKIAAIIL